MCFPKQDCFCDLFPSKKAAGYCKHLVRQAGKTWEDIDEEFGLMGNPPEDCHRDIISKIIKKYK